HTRHHQSGAWVEYGEIETEFVEALIEQARNDPGRAIERVLRRLYPEALCREAPVTALRGHHSDRGGDAVMRRDEGIGDARSGHFLDVVNDRGAELDVVAVGVDHRMIETRADLPGTLMTGHRPNLPRNGMGGKHTPQQPEWKNTRAQDWNFISSPPAE